MFLNNALKLESNILWAFICFSSQVTNVISVNARSFPNTSAVFWALWRKSECVKEKNSLSIFKQSFINKSNMNSTLFVINKWRGKKFFFNLIQASPFSQLFSWLVESEICHIHCNDYNNVAAADNNYDIKSSELNLYT